MIPDTNPNTVRFFTIRDIEEKIPENVPGVLFASASDSPGRVSVMILVSRFTNVRHAERQIRTMLVTFGPASIYWIVLMERETFWRWLRRKMAAVLHRWILFGAVLGVYAMFLAWMRWG